MLSRTLFVTGTDTGVGKTTVTCGLAAALVDRGFSVAVAKPIETGWPADDEKAGRQTDAGRLTYFSGSHEPLDLITPYRLSDPLAPLVAARRAGVNIDLARLDGAVRHLRERHQITLIEGAGGLLVPIESEITFADLALRWQAPLLVVVGNRLGAISHACLTISWAKAHALPIAGYVVNSVSSAVDLASSTNVDTLRELLGAPLGVFPWAGSVACTAEDRKRLAALTEQSLDVEMLFDAIGLRERVER